MNLNSDKFYLRANISVLYHNWSDYWTVYKNNSFIVLTVNFPASSINLSQLFCRRDPCKEMLTELCQKNTISPVIIRVDKLFQNKACRGKSRGTILHSKHHIFNMCALFLLQTTLIGFTTSAEQCIFVFICLC